MKSARILLLFACLLIALQTTAAAYEPTNVIALDDNAYAIKTVAKEEVIGQMNLADENAAQPAVPMPAVSAAPEGVYKFFGVYLVATGPAGGYVKQWRVDRVSSRFT